MVYLKKEYTYGRQCIKKDLDYFKSLTDQDIYGISTNCPLASPLGFCSV